MTETDIEDQVRRRVCIVWHKAVPKISLLPFVDISSFFFFSLCDYGVISLVIERFVKVLHMDNYNKPSTKGHKRDLSELQTKMQMEPSASKQVTVVRRGKTCACSGKRGKIFTVAPKCTSKYVTDVLRKKTRIVAPRLILDFSALFESNSSGI